MIAPDPAPTGRLPAAAMRPAAERDDAPQARGDGADFERVLAGVCKRVAREGRAVVAKESGEQPDAGAVEAAAGCLPEAVPADLPMVPAVPAGPVTAEPSEVGLAVGSAIVEAAAEIAVAMPVASPAPGGAAVDSGGEAVPAAAAVALPAAPPAAAPMPALRPAPVRAAGLSPERKDVREAEEAPREAAPVARHVAAAPAAGAPGSAPPPVSAAGTEVRVAELVVAQDRAPVGWQLTAGAAPPASGGEEARALAQPAAVTPQAVIAQVAVAVGKAADRRVQIRLDPPELGRVQIHLTPVDGGVQAVVLADRPETQDLLRRHADGLARELGAAGYGSVSLDFAAGHEDRDERPAPERPQAGLVAIAVEAAPVAAGRRSLAGGLDVRL